VAKYLLKIFRRKCPAEDGEIDRMTNPIGRLLPGSVGRGSTVLTCDNPPLYPLHQ
jgi:hypothetical protein